MLVWQLVDFNMAANKNNILEWMFFIILIFLGSLIGFGIKKYFSSAPVDLSFWLNSIILIVGGSTVYYLLSKKIVLIWCINF